jgi:16S rRNA (cytidine1402-2'-O)-methyltransferase
MIFFEAPHRLAAALADMAERLGPDRAAAVCRELTKRYEEVRRGSLGELARWAADGVRGEITVVVGGDTGARRAGGPAEWAAQVAELMAAGLSRRDAAAAVAAEAGVSRRDVYAASLGTGG